MQSSYSEAIGILYSKPTFLFRDPQDIVYFAHTILPQRLNAVQFMEIEWNGHATRYVPASRVPKRPFADYRSWSEAWRIIEQMRGLREMRVRLKVSGILK